MTGLSERLFLPGMAVLLLMLLLSMAEITSPVGVSGRMKAGSRWKGEKNRE